MEIDRNQIKETIRDANDPDRHNEKNDVTQETLTIDLHHLIIGRITQSIFEIIVGKSRIRRKMTRYQNRLKMTSFRNVLCRIRVFPTFILKNEMALDYP